MFQVLGCTKALLRSESIEIETDSRGPCFDISVGTDGRASRLSSLLWICLKREKSRFSAFTGRHRRTSLSCSALASLHASHYAQRGDD